MQMNKSQNGYWEAGHKVGIKEERERILRLVNQIFYPLSDKSFPLVSVGKVIRLKQMLEDEK